MKLPRHFNYFVGALAIGVAMAAVVAVVNFALLAFLAVVNAIASNWPAIRCLLTSLIFFCLAALCMRLLWKIGSYYGRKA